jgi:hypothetical protein
VTLHLSPRQLTFHFISTARVTAMAIAAHEKPGSPKRRAALRQVGGSGKGEGEVSHYCATPAGHCASAEASLFQKAIHSGPQRQSRTVGWPGEA